MQIANDVWPAQPNLDVGEHGRSHSGPVAAFSEQRLAPALSSSRTGTNMADVSAIKTIFSPATLIKRGLAPVATSPARSPKPINLYYELHGDADPAATKLIFVMGALSPLPAPTAAKLVRRP